MSKEDVSPSEYAATSRLIYSGPCIVKSVHLSNAGANGTCAVFDGFDTNGIVKATISVFSGDSYTWRPGDGTDFDHGIFVSLAGTNTSVTVTYEPVSRKNPI